jgi:hypothetical protein
MKEIDSVSMVRQPSTLNYWQGWAYLGTSIFASARYTIYLVKYDPALLQRRQQAGPSHEKEPAQKIIVPLYFCGVCHAHLANVGNPAVVLDMVEVQDWRNGRDPEGHPSNRHERRGGEYCPHQARPPSAGAPV